MSSWRTSRPRVAPIDRRTEISRCRVVARDSSRFATLAQTISSMTNATLASQMATRSLACDTAFRSNPRSGTSSAVAR